jgi:hypothetical protein
MELPTAARRKRRRAAESDLLTSDADLVRAQRAEQRGGLLRPRTPALLAAFLSRPAAARPAHPPAADRGPLLHPRLMPSTIAPPPTRLSTYPGR